MCSSAMSSCSYGVIVSTMGVEKDKAWIVVASSAVIMFVGPSTFASYANLVTTVQVETNFPFRIWILNIMYSLFCATAILVTPLTSLKVLTYRKITLIGCLLTATGFILTGITLELNPMWWFLTLSTLVGIGLGLIVTSTFLLVAHHFTKYRGIATGIGIVSVSAGNLLSPFIFDWIGSAKEKLNFHALLIAVAFMAATCYISPPVPTTPTSSPQSSRKRLGSTSSKVSIIEKNKYENEKFLLATGRNGSGGENELQIPTGAVRPRRPSVFMANVASHMLPNIPEERENESQLSSSLNVPSINDTDSDVVVNLNPASGPKNDNKRINFEKPVESQGISIIINEPKNNVLTRRSFEDTERMVQVSRNPTKKFTENHQSGDKIVHAQHHVDGNRNKDEITCSKRLDKLNKFNEVAGEFAEPPTISAYERVRKFSVDMTRRMSQIIEKTKKISLLKNVKFWNMAILSALVSVTVLSFPPILYTHVNQIPNFQGKEQNNFSHMSNSHNESKSGSGLGNMISDTGEIVLNIIFTLDLLSCLVVSYISDYSFFNRRLAFLCSALCGAVIIAVIGFVEDIRLIYFFGIIYGISHGTLVVTESLMFADTFGIEKLGTSYGIVGLLKAIMILIMSIAFQSPTSSYIYDRQSPTLSFSSSAQANKTICSDCDPFDLHSNIVNRPEEALLHRQFLLGITAIPGILCSIIWLVEMLWTYLHAEKSPSQIKIEINSSP